MSLDKQNFGITFGGGLDLKTDQKIVQTDKLTGLENGYWKRAGALDKRNGYRALNTVAYTGEQVVNGTALSVFQDELLQFSDSKVYSFSSASAQWIDKGNAVSVQVNNEQIIRNSYQQLQADSAYIGNIGLYAWEDTRGGIRYTIFDEATETPILADQQASTTGIQPKLLALNGAFYLWYLESSILYVRRINPLDPAGLGTPVSISSTVSVSSIYDVAIYANQFFVIYPNNTETELDVALVTSAPAIALQDTITGSFASQAITAYVTSIGRPAAIWANSGSLYASIFNPNLTPYSSGTIVLDTGVPELRNIAALSFGADGVVFYEISGSASDTTLVKRTSFTESTLATGSNEIFLRSVGLASRPFQYQVDVEGTNRYYINVVHESEFQPTYFTVQNDGYIVAKSQANIAGGLTFRSGLPHVTATANGVFKFPTLETSRIVTENVLGLFSAQYRLIGVSRTQLDFTAPDLFTAQPLGSNTHIVGGLVSVYDGNVAVEAGYNLFPETINTSQSLSGGNIQSGSYVYAATYEWTDNRGQIHRSAPSVLKQVDLAGSSNSSVTVEIPTLRLTNRENVNIVLYRSEAFGVETLYRVTTLTNQVYNDKTVDYIYITDTASDDTIIGNEILYTVGGVLDNIAPPPASLIASFGNRIWLAGLPDGNQLWYSKDRLSGAPVEFNDALTINVESIGGSITAIAPLDDKLIIFKRDRIYFVFGNGPDNTGANGEFASPRLLTSDAGCIAPNSIVNTPDGIFFQSAKGIYKLGSDLTVTYVGAPVEAFNNLPIVSAVLIGDRNQVRFLTESGICLVYDYYFEQWSTFTNHYANDAVIWNDQFLFLNRDGSVWYEVPGYYLDIAQTIKMTLETAWIGLNTLQGYQRVYRTILLMDYRSSHIFNMQIAYDFEQTYRTSIVFDPDKLGFSVYGSDPVYGEAIPYGGEGSGVYQFRTHMPIQKCQALRFKFTDTPIQSINESGEGYSITGLSLQLGMKSGLNRMGPKNSN
jgi:hypothetical protein